MIILKKIMFLQHQDGGKHQGNGGEQVKIVLLSFLNFSPKMHSDPQQAVEVEVKPTQIGIIVCHTIARF